MNNLTNRNLPRTPTTLPQRGEVPHEQWAEFLSDVQSLFKGAPTTVRVRDHHLEEHEQLIARDLPLAELRWRQTPEAVLLSVVQPSQTNETTEMLYPTSLWLLDAEGVVGTPDAGIGLKIESTALTYFVHLGVPLHEL